MTPGFHWHILGPVPLLLPDQSDPGAAEPRLLPPHHLSGIVTNIQTIIQFYRYILYVQEVLFISLVYSQYENGQEVSDIQ